MSSRPRLTDPRPWIYVPVQVKVREFVAKVLQAAVCAERGYGTVLGTHRRLRPSLHRLPPGIVWDYSAAYPLLALFDRYRAAGHRVVACDEEGLVEVPHDAVVGVDRYVAWGDDELERVTAARPAEVDRLRATGHPRFDLLRPELQGLHLPAAEGIRNRLGRYVLVNTNFAGNVQFGVPVLQQTYQFDTEGFTDDDMRWFVERDAFSLQLFEHFKTMIKVVADALPDHTIVLRPHPSENDDTWTAALSGVRNVHVERNGSVVPWLVGADALVHNSCTTGIEAHLAGTNVIAYQPIADERFDWSLPNDVSTRVTSLADLVAELRLAIDALDRGERRASGGSDVLRRHVAAMDGEFAAERIADVFDEVRPPPMSLRTGALVGIRARADYGVITAKHLAKLVLRQTKIPLSYEKQKNPGWDAAEVDGVLADLRRSTGRFADVVAQDLWPHVVAITTR